MPVYQYRCDACAHVFDDISTYALRKAELPCPVCGQTARYTFAVGNVDLESERPNWLRSTVEVVDPDGGPAHREFIANPTRENYRVWLKASGLRPKEAGEPTRPEPRDTSRLRQQMVENHIRRHRIEI